MPIGQGKLQKYLNMDAAASPDSVLLRFTLSAQQWARSMKLDLSIKPLAVGSLDLTNAGGFDGYVELDSQIKAARTRILFEFVTILVTNKTSFSAFIMCTTGFAHMIFIQNVCS